MGGILFYFYRQTYLSIPITFFRDLNGSEIIMVSRLVSVWIFFVRFGFIYTYWINISIFRFRALYKGLLPKVLRLGPGGAIMLVVYDYVYHYLEDRFQPKNWAKKTEDIKVHNCKNLCLHSLSNKDKWSGGNFMIMQQLLLYYQQSIFFIYNLNIKI